MDYPTTTNAATTLSPKPVAPKPVAKKAVAKKAVAKKATAKKAPAKKAAAKKTVAKKPKTVRIFAPSWKGGVHQQNGVPPTRFDEKGYAEVDPDFVDVILAANPSMVKA
jgi:hypothetical protein